MGTLSRWDLVRHETLGIGRVEAIFGPGENPKCAVYFPRNDQQLMVPREELAPLSATEAAAFDLVKLALHDLRAEDAPQTELAERWTGGELVLKPASPERESKTIPLDTFFHKIVMLRDRLRVLEQHINAHKSLSDADKVQVQQYITRIYGTLTTFNILFKNREDQFIGQKGED